MRREMSRGVCRCSGTKMAQGPEHFNVFRALHENSKS